MAVSTYTIASVNGKSGSIVVTPSNTLFAPEYYLNLKTVKLQGDNAFLADGVTNNINATISLTNLDNNAKILTNVPLSALVSIGGVATPASLAGALSAIANLIAE